MAAFAHAGARAIVTMNIPADRLDARWRPLNDTGYHAFAPVR